MDGEIYSGTRIVQNDKNLVESNKKILTGTWPCVFASYYGNENSLHNYLMPVLFICNGSTSNL